MTWLTWRQFRTQALVGAGLLAAFALYVLVTGLQLHHDHATAASTALAVHTNNPLDQLAHNWQTRSFMISGVVIIAPALLGAFWGAPLAAREFEAGTHRLIWNQSVTRTRWLVTKLWLPGVATIALAGLLTLLVDWWAGPLDAVNKNRFDPILFDARGVAPLGYAAFAFVFGVLAGLLLRRTVAAMALTLAVFLAAQFIVPNFVRPSYQTPVNARVNLTADVINHADGVMTSGSGPWKVKPASIAEGSWTVSISGATLPDGTVPSAERLCPPGQVANGDLATCLAAADTHETVKYQPASRFWAFQWTELGLFLALTAASAAGCAVWLLRRRD